MVAIVNDPKNMVIIYFLALFLISKLLALVSQKAKLDKS